MKKRYEVKITQYAEQSMREIAFYIAVDLMSPEAAVNLMKTFQTEINKLDFMPERIHLTPEEPWHSLGIRRMVVKNYYVYFWIDEENSKVQVTDVTYVKRNQHKRLEYMSLES
jgi:toxin ParE1/3/4